MGAKSGGGVSPIDCAGGTEADTGSFGARPDGGVSLVNDADGATSGPITVGAVACDCSDCPARSSALANSCTLPKRSLGSLASAVSTTCSTPSEIVGIFSRNEGEARRDVGWQSR